MFRPRKHTSPVASCEAPAVDRRFRVFVGFLGLFRAL